MDNQISRRDSQSTWSMTYVCGRGTLINPTHLGCRIGMRSHTIPSWTTHSLCAIQSQAETVPSKDPSPECLDKIPFGLAPHWVHQNHTMGNKKLRTIACTVAAMTMHSGHAKVVKKLSSSKTTLVSGGMQRAMLIVLASMAHIPAHVRTLVSIYMPVPCVSVEITALRCVTIWNLIPHTHQTMLVSVADTLSSIVLVPSIWLMMTILI